MPMLLLIAEFIVIVVDSILPATAAADLSGSLWSAHIPSFSSCFPSPKFGHGRLAMARALVKSGLPMRHVLEI